MNGATGQEIARPAGMVSVEVVGFVVPVRTRLPEGSDGGHNQARVNLLKSIITQSQLFHFPRGTVLEKDVGAGYQPLEDSIPGRRVKVQRNPQLVGIEVEEEAGEVGVGDIVKERASPPCLVAHPW